METKTLVMGIAGILILLAAIPYVPDMLEKFRGPDPAIDVQNMARIQEAVQTYGDTTGYYPDSLAALVPDYLETIPRTNEGKAFTYDAQTNTVGMPVEKATTATNPSGTSISPYADSVTGLSVQNELDF